MRIGKWKNNSKISSLSIFPNPSNGIVNFYAEKFSSSELIVIDGLGKIVFVKHLNNGKLIVAGLESGVYSVQLLDNEIIQLQEKFIIIR